MERSTYYLTINIHSLRLTSFTCEEIRLVVLLTGYISNQVEKEVKEVPGKFIGIL